MPILLKTENIKNVPTLFLKLAQKGKADFADFLIAQINIAHGCGTTITFDNAAAEINSKTLLA